MTKTDMQLKRDIEEELRWDPKVNAARIGVTVEGGAVSLLGEVDTYPEKWAAEDAAKRVSGVRTVAQDLTVKVLTDHVRSDSEIAAATQSVLGWDLLVPATVTATVHQGAVTLGGEATWNDQREAAERAVRHLAGVVAVNDSIRLKPQASAEQVREKVHAALQRQATSDAKSIHIELGRLIELTAGRSLSRCVTSSTSRGSTASRTTFGSRGLAHQVRELRRVHVCGDPQEVVDKRRDGHADVAAIGLEHLEVDLVPCLHGVAAGPFRRRCRGSRSCGCDSPPEREVIALQEHVKALRK